MLKEIDLTNEKLKKIYKNNFELANHAIEIAEKMIGTEDFCLECVLDDLMQETLQKAE